MTFSLLKRDTRHAFIANASSKSAKSLRSPQSQAEVLEPRRLFSTYVVNTLSDSLAVATGMTTLRQAVASANAHPGADTVTFSPAVFGAGSQHTIKLQNDEIKFTDTTGTTTITGPGAASLAISGNIIYRIFEVAKGASASISGLQVMQGSPGTSSDGQVYGGDIYNGGTLLLNHVTVTGGMVIDSNNAGFGGGIYSNGKLTVDNCNVSNNTVSGSTNGGPAYGAGIYALGTLAIANSTISANSAFCSLGSTAGASAQGGGIFVGTGASASLSGDVITTNHVTGGDSGFSGSPGGAAYGGGICALGTVYISASSVSNNTATSGETDGGSNKYAAGGGIYTTTKLSLTQSTVSGNTVTGGNAAYGGVAGGSVLGGGICTLGALTVLQSTLSGNNAYAGAGNGNDNPIQATPIPGGNSYGGGLWSDGPTTVTDSTIANNSSHGGYGSAAGPSSDNPNGTAGGNGGSGEAGGIFSETTFTLDNSTVSGNLASAGPGGASYTDPNPPNKVLPGGANGNAFAGGMFGDGAVVNNTIISANHSSNGADLFGALNSSSSYNLIGTGGNLINGVNGNKVGINNPGLSPLGNFGGPTQTMMPLVSSPAIDAGKNSLVPTTLTVDQRGLKRIVGSAVDIGAVEFSKIVISGNVYNDLNGDGVHQSSEVGLANWQVYIDLADAGVYQAGDPIATTNSAGNYTLTYSPITVNENLIVREIRQTNWRRTQPGGIYPLGFYTINEYAGTAGNVNFGDSATSLVTGTVYHDINANGKQDTGEAGLASWSVNVDYLVGSVWHNNAYHTTTDANGQYSFVLIHGTYRIHEVLKSGFTPTVPGSAGYTLTLATGATVTSEYFGDQ